MSKPERISLHTHTKRCKHASGELRDYCVEAVRQEMSVLGFSDHSPFPDKAYQGSRMDFSELAAYRADLEQAKLEFPELHLLAGLEIDYRPRLGKAFYEEVYLGEYQLDYLIGGVHFLHPEGQGVLPLTRDFGGAPEPFKLIIKNSVRLMESGLIRYLVHPDMVAQSIKAWTPEIRDGFAELIRTSNDTGVALEINAYGLRKPAVEESDGTERAPYPWEPFWELAGELGAKYVVAGADAHRPADVWGNVDACLAIAKKYGLEIRTRDLVDQIKTGRAKK